MPFSMGLCDMRSIESDMPTINAWKCCQDQAHLFANCITYAEGGKAPP